MAEEMIYIDISDVPDLLRIAEEVRTTRKPRMLRRDNENVAVLMPVTSTRRRKASRTKSKADYEAFRAAGGGWKGLVDTDKLIRDIYESRKISTKPPVEL
jgi:hypothetical protein